MREIRNILGWLGAAKEHSILMDAQKHVDETCRTVNCLAEAVKALVSGDISAKAAAIENTKESERAADRLRAHIIDQLSEGILLAPDREDMLRLVKAVDKIADLSNSAARLLWFVEAKLPENVLKHISMSTELIVGAAARLGDAIRAMGKNDMTSATEFCTEVECFEHEADDQKRHLIGEVLHAQLDPATLLVCYNLAEELEAVTDKIEAAADMIRLLIVKAR